MVTVEDNGRAGSFGAHLSQALQGGGIDVPVRSLGLPQTYLAQGKREDILRDHGLDADGIAATVADLAAAVPSLLGTRFPVPVAA